MEDEGDRYGTIASYDPVRRLMAVQAASGVSYTFTLTADAEIELEDVPGLDYPDTEGQDDDDSDSDADNENSDADASLLTTGASITELEVEHGLVEEVELLRSTCR